MEIEQCVFLFSSPQPPCGRVRLARFARLRLLTYTNPILRKEPTVLQPSAKSAVSCESAQFRWENSTHRPRPPGTRSEQFSCARVTEFSLTSLFLERFWRELTISFRSHKPNIKTKNPKNGIFDLLMTFDFSFHFIFIKRSLTERRFHSLGKSPVK